MITSLMALHAVVSFLLVVLVLVQFGKGAEAGLISGAGSDQVFSGATKGNILSHATVVIAAVFLINSIVLAKLQSNRAESSILDNEAPISRPLNNDAAKAPVSGDAKKADSTIESSKKDTTKTEPAAAEKKETK